MSPDFKKEKEDDDMEQFFAGTPWDATKILVMDRGRIIQQGAHNELIKNKGYYKELYEKQLLEKELS